MGYVIAAIALTGLVALYVRRQKRLDNARWPGMW
jgi:hypothetical protein